MPKSAKNPSPPAHTARRLGKPSLAIICVAITAITGGLIFADWHRTVSPSAHSGYVGRQSCVQCHTPEAAAFHDSHHDQAMDRATPDTVLGDFSGVELAHDGIVSRMYKRGERFMVRTEGPDGELADFEVKYTLGVDPLQNYMVEFDRPNDMQENEVGRLQVLRITWDTRNKKWFYLPPPDVHEKLAPDDELHWCGVGQRWNTMCADCHSTNVQKQFSEDDLRYRTTFSEIDVSCEACHGPGGTHVALASRYSLFWDRKLGYGLQTRLKVESNEAQVQVCAECHARRQVLAGDYDPGDNYWDHYNTELLTALTYQPDGQIEDEVFEHGSFLQSKMYHKNVKCTDCHDPHTAKLKHEGNKLCTSCHQHAAGKYDTPLHHHHKEGTAGASCVSCHMPTTNYMELHGRRDHSFRVPRPDLSVDLGTSNACTGCHLDQKKLTATLRASSSKTNPDHLKQYLHFVMAARSGEPAIKQELARLDKWSTDAIEKWYGHPPQKPEDPQHFSYALAAARKNDPDAEPLLANVVKNRTLPGIVRATALEAWQAYGSGAMLDASQQQLEDPSPQVRAAAAANLAPLPAPQRARMLAPRLEDETFLVRRVAARALADASGELSRKHHDLLQDVLNQWVEGLMQNNDRAGAHLAVGDLQLQMRNFDAAQVAYRQAIRVEPDALGARGQLALLLEALAADGVIPKEQHEEVRTEVLQLRSEELALLRRDAERAPNLAIVQFRYGQALLNHEELTAGLAALAKAVHLDPTSPDFRLHYAWALYREGQREAGVAQVEALLRFHPRHADALELLRRMRAGE